MRYILNDSGYIEAISFGCSIECKDKTCTEYTGSIPEGYETLAIWSETANINAYKIVDGNLTYDSTEDTRLKTLWANQLSMNTGGTNTNNYSTEEQMIGTWLGKPLYRKIVEVGTINATTEKSIATNTSNIEVVISLTGMGKLSFGWVPLNFHNYKQTDSSSYVYINTSNNTIRMQSLFNYIDCYVTIEYTKTTD